MKNGKWYIWDNNGNLLFDMTYKNGQKSGLWIMWNEKGEKIDEKLYK
jgi:antitoxin component YwqK of YwqJK toxin-antitoxin module